MAERKYYLIEGDEAETLCASIKAERKRFNDSVNSLREQYGASAVFIRGQHRISSIGFSSPEPREGFKVDLFKTQDHYLGHPDRRTKIGKQIEKEMKAASSPKCPSDVITEHYNAVRWVPQSDGGSRTGMSMAVSVGYPLPDWKRITLDVPVCDKEPFTPPAGAREIKKSEYIALTEESS